jgi:hypothetical protein
MGFTSRYNWKNEIDTLKYLGSLGMSMAEIARKYEVSKQRLEQVVKRYIPEWKENYGHAVVRKVKAEQYTAKWGVKEDSELYAAKRLKFRQKKYLALKSGIDWDIDFGQITWPTYCPILNLELDYFAESRQENSPSFDRIDSAKGYVQGNVQVISWRANRIKNDGTAEEHALIAEYLKSLKQD